MLMGKENNRLEQSDVMDALLHQIKEKPEKFWFKPGQVKSWTYCLQLGDLYPRGIVRIGQHMLEGYYNDEADEEEDVFKDASRDLCKHYYLNDTDGEKVILLLAKVLKFYYSDQDDENEGDTADAGQSVAEENKRDEFVLGRLSTPTFYDPFDNPANELEEMVAGDLRMEGEGEEPVSRRPSYTTEQIENTDIEDLDLSKEATCDFMRNRYILVKDYVERCIMGIRTKEVRESSVVEMFNGLVRRRFHGFYDEKNSFPNEEYEGKKKCNILRDIRRDIAKANDIPYHSEDCTFEGDCPGTCPKCDEEIRYLQRMIDERREKGLEVVINRVDPGVLKEKVSGSRKPERPEVAGNIASVPTRKGRNS